MINRRAPEPRVRSEEPRADVRYDRNFTPTGTADMKRSNRVYVIALALALMAFTGGILAGMKLAEIRNLESSIVKYPDGARGPAASAPAASAPSNPSGGNSETVSLANTAPSANMLGKYLIKIGTFSPEESETLVLRLNSIRELDPVRPLNCKHVKQTVGGRKLAFSIPLKEGEVERKNGFVGCFDDQAQAGSVVNIVTSSGLPGTSNAKLYEIE